MIYKRRKLPYIELVELCYSAYSFARNGRQLSLLQSFNYVDEEIRPQFSKDNMAKNLPVYVAFFKVSFDLGFKVIKESLDVQENLAEFVEVIEAFEKDHSEVDLTNTLLDDFEYVKSELRTQSDLFVDL